jgi:hypothetical protein
VPDELFAKFADAKRSLARAVATGPFAGFVTRCLCTRVAAQVTTCASRSNANANAMAWTPATRMFAGWMSRWVAPRNRTFAYLDSRRNRDIRFSRSTALENFASLRIEPYEASGLFSSRHGKGLSSCRDDWDI